MSIKIPSIVAITLFCLGGVFLLVPSQMAPQVGIAVLSCSAIGIWPLSVWYKRKHLTPLVSKRVHSHFLEANFDSIGMSSPYIDFYFNIHSCLPYRLILTGRRKGELWNPRIEAWHSNWSIDIEYQSNITPDIDTKIRVRWLVPQGHHSPMSEFAFRAQDTHVQNLTFEDMSVELKARILRTENNIGWMQLAQGIYSVDVPDHPVFDTVRKEYLRQKNSREY